MTDRPVVLGAIAPEEPEQSLNEQFGLPNITTAAPPDERVSRWKGGLLATRRTPSDREAQVMAEQFAAWDWPELHQMLDDDFDRALRMTDRDSIVASMQSAHDLAARELGGVTGGGFREGADLDAIYEEAALVYSDLSRFVQSTGRMITESQEALQTWERIDRELVNSAVDSVTGEVRADFGPEILDGVERQLKVEGAKFTGRNLSFNMSEDGKQVLLALETSNPNARDEGQEDTLTFFQNVVLDEGTEINSEWDMIRELLYADVGLRHSIVGSDELPGQQTNVGRVLEAAGWLTQRNPVANAIPAAADLLVRQSANALGGLVAPKPDEPVEDVAERVKSEYVADRVTADTVVAAWANMVLEANPGLATGEAIAESSAVWDELSPEAREELLTKTREDAFTELGSEEAKRIAESLTDERGPAEKTLDNAFGAALSTIEWWDKLVHKVFIGIADSGLRVAEPMLGTTNEAWGQWAEGVIARDPGDADYVSEYFGLGDEHKAWAFWLDMGVSVGFDPLNFMFSSGKTAAKLNWELFSDPANLGRAVQAPHFRAQARVAADMDLMARFRLFSSQGMWGDDLLEALTAPGETELRAIMTRQLPSSGLGGFYIPDPGFHLAQRNSMLGLAEVIRKTGGRDQGTMRKIQAMISNASPDRGVSLGKDAMDDAARYLEPLFLNRPEEDFMQAVTDLVSSYKVSYTERHSRLALARRNVELGDAQIEDLMNEYPLSVRALPAREDSIATLQKQVDTFESELRRESLAARAATAAGEDNTALRDAMTALSDELDITRQKLDTLLSGTTISDHERALHDEFMEAYATLKAEREVAWDALRRLDGPDNRWALQAWWSDQYRAWAEIQNGGPFANQSEYKAFWGELRAKMGHEGWGRGDDAPDDMWAFFAKGDEELEELYRTGVNRVPGHTVLPASPADLVAYEAGFQGVKVPVLSRAANALHTFFVTNVLSNPMTILRSNLDDPLRQAIRFGVRGGERISGLGYDASGALVIKREASNPNLLQQINPFSRRSMWRRDLDGLGPYAHEMAQKELIGPLATRPHNDGYQLIPPAAKGQARKLHNRAARQFIDGIVSNDDAMRHYAMAALEAGDDGLIPNVFADWWDAKGSQMFFGTGIRSHGAEVGVYFTTRDEFYAGLGMWFDELARNNPQTRQRLLEHVAERKPIPRDLADQVGPVFAIPTASVNGSQADMLADSRVMEQIAKGRQPGHISERIFSTAYELPAGNRAGIVYQNFFDESLQAFVKAYDGKVISPARLVDDGFVGGGPDRMADIAAAQRLINDGSEVIEDLMGQGLVTARQLEVQAHKYAKQRTLQMMYQPGASSLLGRGYGKLMFPFGRAHTDFLSWYGRELTNGTWLAPWLANATGKTMLGAGSHVLPLNLRLLSRTSHVLGQTNRQVEELQANTASGDVGPVSVEYKAFSPGELIRRFSFLPYAFDHSMMVDLVPGLGPVPAGLLHLIGEDSPLYPVREAANTVFPGQSYDPRTIQPSQLWETIAPRQGSSITAMLAQLADFGLSSIPEELRESLPLGTTVWELAREPRGYRVYTKQVLAEVMADPELRQELFGAYQMDPGLQEQFGSIVNYVEAEAAKRSAAENMMERIGQMTGGFADVSFPDVPQVDSFRGFMEYVDVFTQAGIVPEDVRDDLKETWAKIEEGEGSYQERQFFISRALDTVFGPSFDDMQQDKLIILAPDIVTNFVSYATVVNDANGQPKGEVLARANGDPIWPNDPNEARELSREAYDRGWVTSKPLGEWMSDVVYREARAKSNVLRGLLTDRTGRDDSTVLKKDLGRSYTLSGFEKILLDKMQVEIPESGTMEELKALVDVYREVPRRSLVGPNSFLGVLTANSVQEPLAESIITMWDSFESEFSKRGVDPWDWPEEVKEPFRKLMIAAIDDPDIPVTRNNYQQHLAGTLGDIDYETPTPPAESGLEWRLTTTRRDVTVVDGDTVNVLAGDGTQVSVRLMGINAPDRGQPGYAESYTDLRTLLDSAESITFGAFDLDRFGLINFPDVDRDRFRLKLWLYVDGEPIWHPQVFTSQNPAGVELGGKYLPIKRASEVADEPV